MKTGIRKTIVEYVGTKGYCNKCGKNSAPPEIRKYGANTLYGHGVKAWVIYQRVDLRLPYESIASGMLEQFNETMHSATVGQIIREFGEYYAGTEEQLARNLLKSPCIQAD